MAVQRLYFIGLHYPAMAGLAVVAKRSGLAVSGSGLDIDPLLLNQLHQAGIHAHSTFDPDQVPSQALIVVATWLNKHNSELKAAQPLQLDTISQSQLIQQFCQDQRRVAVIGSAQASLVVSAAISADLVADQPLNPTDRWSTVSAVHLEGQPQVVIQTGFSPASVLDPAYRLLYVQPQVAIFMPDWWQRYNRSGSGQAITHLFSDMAAAYPGQAQVIVADTDTTLIHTATQAGLACHTYGQTAKAEWQARKVEFFSRRQVFWLYHQGKQVDMLDLPLLGREGLSAALAGLAAASIFDQNQGQALQSIANTNSLYHRYRSVPMPGNVSFIEFWAEHPEDAALAVQDIGQTHVSSGNNQTYWVVIQSDRPDAALERYHQALTYADAFIIVGSATAWPHKALADIPLSLRTKPHYALTAGQAAKFLAKTVSADDVICSLYDDRDGNDAVVGPLASALEARWQVDHD